MRFSDQYLVFTSSFFNYAAWRSDLILLDLMTILILGQNYEALLSLISSILLPVFVRVTKPRMCIESAGDKAFSMV
jgi:hypothetical protein